MKNYHIPFKILGALTWLLAIIFVPMGFASSITLPVKRGQTTVDASRLPFACITFAMVDFGMPLEKLVLEDLATHKKMTAQLGKTFGNSHPDYPVGHGGDRQTLAMAVMELKPGRYRVSTIEFTPPAVGNETNSCVFSLPKGEEFSFAVTPGCVNYFGCIMIEVDWSTFHMPVPSRVKDESHFSTRFTVLPAAARDRKWAAKAIPGLATLPSVESTFGTNSTEQMKSAPNQSSQATQPKGA